MVYDPKAHAENEKKETMKATENPKPAAPTKPKKATEISGWNSQSSLRHIHCPKCGKIITHNSIELRRMVDACFSCKDLLTKQIRH